MSGLVRLRAIVGVEFKQALRNRWVLSATLGLLIFALALGFLGAGPSAQGRGDPLSLTAASLATLSVYLVPLLALLISYDALSGELERGTLALVLATPLSRGELMLGKLISHLLVLGIALGAGFGIAGLAVGAVSGFALPGILAWWRLIWTGLLLGAVFIVGGILISAVARKTATAAAMAIGLWLAVTVLYDVILLAGLILDREGMFTKLLFPYLVIANPGDAFRLFNLSALEAATPVAGVDGLARTMPYPSYVALTVLGGWMAILGAGGLAAIKRLQP